jgi:hypothetical protein
LGARWAADFAGPLATGWPANYNRIADHVIECDEFMATIRCDRGKGDASHEWRDISTCSTYLRSEINSVIRHCKKMNWNPASLDPDKATEYVQTLQLGSAGTDKHLRAVDTIRTYGYGYASFKHNPDVQLAKKSAMRRTEAIARAKREAAKVAARAVASGAAAGNAPKTTKADAVPPQNLQQVFIQMRAEVATYGGIIKLPTAILLEHTLFALKTDFALRGTGLANLPWYHFRREPQTASLIDCKRWWIASVDTKELKLQHRYGWSAEVECTQPVNSNDVTRSSVLVTEVIRRLTTTAIGGSTMPTPSKLYGRDVYSDRLFIQRGRKETVRGVNKWVLDSEMQSSTLHNYVSRLTTRAGYAFGFNASHLRHLHATYLCHGWVKQVDSGYTMTMLRDRMRHSKEKTTQRHYVQQFVHADVVLRWELLGYAKLALLATTEMLRG